jgi:hypothetical protein
MLEHSDVDLINTEAATDICCLRLAEQRRAADEERYEFFAAVISRFVATLRAMASLRRVSRATAEVRG